MRNIVCSLYVWNKVSIFLIRVKDITSNGILSTISSEECEDEFDIDTVKINKKGIENEISEKTKETQHLF